MGSGSEGLGCGNDVGDACPEVGWRESRQGTWEGCPMCTLVHTCAHVCTGTLTQTPLQARWLMPLAPSLLACPCPECSLVRWGSGRELRGVISPTPKPEEHSFMSL